MPNYSNRSLELLQKAHPDLITLFEYVVEAYDNTIVFSERTPAEQFELYKKGRKEIGSEWIILNKKEVVTYKDGYEKKSKHNYSPSLAVDVYPYIPGIGMINGTDKQGKWDNEELKQIYHFAGYVMAMARALKKYGVITHDIRWGGDWDSDTDITDQSFMDLFHFEII